MEDIQADLDAGRRRQDQAQQAMDACQKGAAVRPGPGRTLTNAMDGYQLRQSGRLHAGTACREQLRRETSQLDSVSPRPGSTGPWSRIFESYNKSVRSIMQESRRGGLEHIHGPVSHLIHTEDRFTTAIEIALGAAMQQIVVDTESDAKAAIGFLKRTGGGRATFLPLSAISPAPCRSPGGQLPGLCGGGLPPGPLRGPVPGDCGEPSGPDGHCGGAGQRHRHGPAVPQPV